MSFRIKALAIVAGVAVFAAVSASAATLGGLRTNDLGANSNVVAAHVTGGVVVSFTPSYSLAAGYYVVSSVTLTPIVTATDKFGSGATVTLTLKGASNSSLTELTGTTTAAQAIAGASFTLPVSLQVAAADIQGVSLVINGGVVSAAVTGND